MKRIAIILVTLLMSLTATANSVRYFTYQQALRTVQYLNAQNEMMIYCGYDYEIETYVLVNEVWMERYNSSFYEIWVYGYDAYTGDEIYMPLDLQCVWLFSSNRIYNAAQYLRFHVSVVTPSITWYVPSYNHYTRISHRPGFVASYHYTVHQHGWRPNGSAYGGAHPPLPPYYNRTPHTPAPQPAAPWTPGVNKPQVPTPTGVGVTNGATQVVGNRGTSSTTSSRTSSAGTTPTRSNATGTTTRSSSTNTSSTSRSTTTSTPQRSSATTKSSRSSNNATTTSSRSSSSATSTSSRSNSSATTTSSRSNSSTATTRSTGTASSRSTNGTTRNTGTTSTKRTR